MKFASKKIALFTVLSIAICTPNLAFAQTVQTSVPQAPEAPATELSQPAELQEDVIQIGESKPITSTRKASWEGKDVAIRGRDVVAFHTGEGSVKGSKKYVADYDDTKWRFTSEKNRDVFLQDPEKYVPQFGGYCPVALAKNKAKVGKSNQFTVVDDKLYLNYNKSNQAAFSKTPDDFLVKAKLNF